MAASIQTSTLNADLDPEGLKEGKRNEKKTSKKIENDAQKLYRYRYIPVP
jgi:hypothetical protein